MIATSAESEGAATANERRRGSGGRIRVAGWLIADDTVDIPGLL